MLTLANQSALHDLAARLGRVGPAGFSVLTELVDRFENSTDDVDFSTVLLSLCERTRAIGVALDGRVVSANAYWANTLGYRPCEMRGMALSELIAGPGPDLINVARPFVAKIPHRHKSGRIIPTKVTAFPVLGDRGRVFWIGLFEVLE